MSQYSTQLQLYLQNPIIPIPIEIKEELKGRLANRPVVTLANTTHSISYLRPGIDKAIQRAFVTKNTTIDTPKTPPLTTLTDDARTPLRYTKNPDDLKQLFALCEKIGLLRELYLEIVTHDTDYFQQLVNRPSPAVGFSPLGFEECSCKNHRSNRLFTDSRYRFEEHFVAHIESTVPKDQCVKVLSLANGKLLQDWKCIGLLIDKGYTRFEWTLVDPINSQNRLIDTFRDFFTKIASVTVTVHVFDNLADVPQQPQHAVTIVDIADGAFDELLATLGYLEPNGKIIQSGGPHLIEITASGIQFIHHPESFTTMYKDIVQAIPKSPARAIRLAVYEDFMFTLHAIHALKTQGTKEIHLFTDKELDTDFLKAFFPMMIFTIENVSEDDFDTRLGTNEHFDFIVMSPLDEDNKGILCIENFQQATAHELQKSTTAYLPQKKSLSIFRWVKRAFTD